MGTTRKTRNGIRRVIGNGRPGQMAEIKVSVLADMLEDGDRCAGAEKALRTAQVALDMANTDRDELTNRVAELEVRNQELERMVDARTPLAVNAIGLEEDVARLKALAGNLMAVVDIAKRIDRLASGEEWWCDELAAAIDALGGE